MWGWKATETYGIIKHFIPGYTSEVSDSCTPMHLTLLQHKHATWLSYLSTTTIIVMLILRLRLCIFFPGSWFIKAKNGRYCEFYSSDSTGYLQIIKHSECVCFCGVFRMISVVPNLQFAIVWWSVNIWHESSGKETVSIQYTYIYLSSPTTDNKRRTWGTSPRDVWYIERDLGIYSYPQETTEEEMATTSD
jgi:hypothetical protein